jgi:hypothetical protein
MPEVLPPIEGLEFFKEWHRYRYKGDWLLHSVTQVLAGELDSKARAQIEKTRHGPMGWEIRGNTVHACLEQHLLGEAELDPGDFSDWVTPLLSSWLFKSCTPLAVEYRVVDPRKSLAGSMDFVLRTLKGTVVLGDLKTVSSAPAARSRKPAEAQLGAYAAMLIDHHPRLTIDKCVTVVAGPGICEIKPSDPSECIAKWLDAWDCYQLLQPDF